ncbi:hypothetical protein LY76DRAFT_609725 [Colletotrichum caudatum]|nr:hypothetical protein LY76DRAFT_609725 [Colletotrichum caudatum]
MDFSAGDGVSSTHPKASGIRQQQHQHHHHQPVWSPFQQQQSPFQQLLGNRAAAPSALTLTPTAPWPTADPQSSISTQSSHSWQDPSSANTSEPLSSPTSSLLSLVAPQFIQSVGETRPFQPTDSPEAPKRRRGRPRLSETSQRAKAAPTPAAKAPRKTKRQRSSSASASEDDDDDSSSKVGGGGGSDDDDEKRNRVRARNREAAHKCRQKTQKGISQLQTQEAVMGGINRSLKSEAEMLRGEILLLKHMVLQHSGCGCSFIEGYIAGAAQSLVQSGARISASPRGGNAEADFQHAMAGGGDECYVDRRAYDPHGGKADMCLTGFESGFFDFDTTPYHAAGIQL